MADDNDLIEEYEDYSDFQTTHSKQVDHNIWLYKELNQLRYKLENGYITEDKFFSEIENHEFYSFLKDKEWKKLEKRRDEKRKLVTKVVIKTKPKPSSNNIFLIIFIILMILIALTTHPR